MLMVLLNIRNYANAGVVWCMLFKICWLLKSIVAWYSDMHFGWNLDDVIEYKNVVV